VISFCPETNDDEDRERNDVGQEAPPAVQLKSNIEGSD